MFNQGIVTFTLFLQNEWNTNRKTIRQKKGCVSARDQISPTADSKAGGVKMSPYCTVRYGQCGRIKTHLHVIVSARIYMHLLC